MDKSIFKDYWEKIRNNPNNNEREMESNFTTLAPKIFNESELEANKIYFDSLEEALQIEENKNIALMGSYGSGKSSIIKTFMIKNKKHKYLSLSLASFFEKEDSEGNTGNHQEVQEETEFDKFGRKTKISRMIGNKVKEWEKIEQILVKQMIYKLSPKELPYSRFKRISNLSEFSLLSNSVLIFTLTVSMTDIGFLSRMIEQPLSLINVGYLLLSFLAIYFIRSLLSYISRAFKFSKFTFKSLTVEQNNNDTSYFSKYLDEIIYFFEVSKTDIVIIEDIDRFNSLTIFEHLRELNYLLNNSNQIKQDIKFIYAVRDDLFNHDGDSILKESEEYLRTKFFDFIIPVIPVVDYKNSREFLVPKVKSIIENHDSKSIIFDDDLKKYLWGVSLYIDDLRLIHNIANELIVYLHRLSHINTAEKFKKLFAMIIYKNVYPEDFSALQRESGKIYEVFNMVKNNLLKSKREEINQKIRRHEDIINSGSYDIRSNARLAIVNLFLEENDDNISSGNIIINYFPDPRGGITYKPAIPLTDDVVNDFLQVKEMMQLNISGKTLKISKTRLVENFNRFGVNVDKTINILTEEEKQEREDWIQKLKEERMFLDTLTVKEIIDKGYDSNTSIVERFPKNKLLVKYMLSEGFIDEQFIDYISLFYDGSLKTSDLAIVQKLKSNTKISNDEKITDFEAVLFELAESDYRKSSILNINIILHVFNKKKYVDEQKNIISVFKYKIDDAFRVALLKNLFKESKEKISLFMSMSLDKIPDLYSELSLSSSGDVEFNNKLAYNIVGLIEVESLQTTINKDSTLKSKIESLSDFVPKLFGNYNLDEEKFNRFFAENNFKFEKLGLKEMNTSNKNFYIKNHLYQINESNVRDIYEEITEKRDVCLSISELLDGKMEELSNHIDSNFEKYIEVLNNQETIYESNDVLLRILNESEVAEEDKKAIIIKSSNFIKDITKINSSIHRLIVFENIKYVFTLQNFMNAIDEEIKYVIPQFNLQDIVKILIKEAENRINKDEIFERNLKEFMIKLVNQHGIIVNNNNIDFFKIHTEYKVDDMNPCTFINLLNAGCIKPTISNINNLIDQNKIDLIAEDVVFASENYSELNIKPNELLLGIQQFEDPLLSQMVNSSFQDEKLIVSDRVKWLEEIQKQGIELGAVQIDKLFSYTDIIESDVFMTTLVKSISNKTLTDTDLLNKVPVIDKSLKNIKVGLRGEKKTDIKYLSLLKALSDRNILGKVKVENDVVSFWNKRT